MLRRNQWVTLSLILLLALITRVVTAETSASSIGALPSKKLSSDKSSTLGETFKAPGNSKELEVSVGPGLALWTGTWGWSLNAGAVTQVISNLPLYVGADLGIDFWSLPFPVSGAAARKVGLQALPTAYYKFEVSGLPMIHPYAGLSVGPNLVLASGFNKVYFELLARPGLAYQISSELSLAVEPKFGILGSDFAFIPTVTGIFAL